MMFLLCRTISMCEVKYIWNFIVTLFIQPMKDIILQFSCYLCKTKQTTKNSQRTSKQSISFEFLTNKMNCELMLTYDAPALQQTGSRNLTGQKTLPTIWGTYMKLVTKYQISAINSCWEKCDEKCKYMFNVYKNQLSRQTGSRNLMGPNTLPTIWYTYMMLVTKYQISAINSYWEKCDEKYLGRTDGRTDRRTEVKQYIPLPLRGAGV